MSRAEKLREAIRFGIVRLDTDADVVERVAAAIVEDLGITRKMVEALETEINVGTSSADHERQIRGTIAALTTLLDAAGASE